VEGGCGTRNLRHSIDDQRNRRIGRLDHFPGSYSKHLISILIQESVALAIVKDLCAAIVRLAIDLDRKSKRRTIEVGDIGANRMLAPKLHAGLSAAQTLPQ
jgi:hypothetical protein